MASIYQQAKRFCNDIAAKHPDWTRDKVSEEAAKRLSRVIPGETYEETRFRLDCRDVIQDTIDTRGRR